MGNDLARRDGTSLERKGFGSREVERRHETASTAIAAQAQAEIQARFIMAMQHPRIDDNVRVKLLRECARPNFAKRAFYSLPRGTKAGRITGIKGRIEGLSVRFAESAIRLMGNVRQVTRTLYDDDVKRMINVSVTDLETNAGYDRDLVIEKTVERQVPRDGAVILGKRTSQQTHARPVGLRAKSATSAGVGPLSPKRRESRSYWIGVATRRDAIRGVIAGRARLTRRQVVPTSPCKLNSAVLAGAVVGH